MSYRPGSPSPPKERILSCCIQGGHVTVIESRGGGWGRGYLVDSGGAQIPVNLRTVRAMVRKDFWLTEPQANGIRGAMISTYTDAGLEAFQSRPGLSKTRAAYNRIETRILARWYVASMAVLKRGHADDHKALAIALMDVPDPIRELYEESIDTEET